jgi:chromosome partitioning protein
MKALATWSIKGGVGKTSAAANLAWLAAREGRRTLLWDLDPQGAATYLFRVKDKVPGGSAGLVRAKDSLSSRIKHTTVPLLDVLPANLALRHLDLALDELKKPTRRLGRLLDSVADDYDLAVLDCPPSVSLVSESVVEAVDVLLVPVVPATLSVRTLEQLTKFVSSITEQPPAVLAFLSMADRRRMMHRDLADQLRVDRTDIAMTAIPDAAVVERMALRAAPVVATAPNSPAAQAYAELWIETSALLWPNTGPPRRLELGGTHWSD